MGRTFASWGGTEYEIKTVKDLKLKRVNDVSQSKRIVTCEGYYKTDGCKSGIVCYYDEKGVLKGPNKNSQSCSLNYYKAEINNKQITLCLDCRLHYAHDTK